MDLVDGFGGRGSPAPFDQEREISAHRPGFAGTRPRLLTINRIRRLGKPALFGRWRPNRQVPVMAAALSRTPAAVFVCQRTHSTADL